MAASKSPRKHFWLFCASEKTEISNATHPNSSPAERSWKKMLPGLGISLLSLGIVFYFADLQRFVQALKLADYRLVAISATITLLWLVVRAQVWRTLLLNRPTSKDTFFAVNEGYLINNILPFRLGELARAYLLARKSGMGFFQTFPSVIIERLLDLGMAVGLLLATLPLVVGGSWARPAALTAGVLVLVLYSGLFLLARYRTQAQALLNRVFTRLPFLNRRVQRFLPELFSGLEVLTNGKRFISAAGWVLLNWILAIAQYYILMQAFFPQAKLLWAAFSLGVVSLGIAAPSSPGSVGVLELSVVGALSIFKLDSSTALAFALVLHAIQYVLTGVLGAYALSRDGDSLSGIFHRLQSLRKDTSPDGSGAQPEATDADATGSRGQPGGRQ